MFTAITDSITNYMASIDVDGQIVISNTVLAISRSVFMCLLLRVFFKLMSTNTTKNPKP